MTTICEIHSDGRQLVRLMPDNTAEQGVLSEMAIRSGKGERIALKSKDGEYTLEVAENGA